MSVDQHLQQCSLPPHPSQLLSGLEAAKLKAQRAIKYKTSRLGPLNLTEPLIQTLKETYQKVLPYGSICPNSIYLGLKP